MEGVDSSLRIVGVRVAKALLTVAALVTGLSLVGIDMTAFSVFTGALGVGLGLAVLVPSIAVTIRRLHDTERSGWWILIAFVPLVGGIVLLVFMCLDGTGGPNKFGPDPKGGASGLPAAA